MRKIDHESRSRKDGSEPWPRISVPTWIISAQPMVGPQWSIQSVQVSPSSFVEQEPGVLWFSAPGSRDSWDQRLHCSHIITDKQFIALQSSVGQGGSSVCSYALSLLNPPLCALKRNSILSAIYSVAWNLPHGYLWWFWHSPSLFTICYIVYWTLILAKHCQCGSYLP